jgi:hypothetical protein
MAPTIVPTRLLSRLDSLTVGVSTHTLALAVYDDRFEVGDEVVIRPDPQTSAHCVSAATCCMTAMPSSAPVSTRCSHRGLNCLKLPPRSPDLNAFAERWVCGRSKKNASPKVILFGERAQSSGQAQCTALPGTEDENY